MALVVLLVVAGTVLALSGGNGGPSTTPPTPADSASGASPPAPSATSSLSPAQMRLADLLDPFKVRNCRSSPTGDVPGVDAALVCDALGVDEVRALLYVDAGALDDDVERRSNAIEDVGDCDAGEDSTEYWGRSTDQHGWVTCSSAADGFHLYWTVNDDLVAYEVSGPDGVELVAWFRRFVS